MPEPYSNRELDGKFREIQETLERIEVQTSKTNGSVANLKLWRAYLTGAVAVLLFLISAVLIPLTAAYIAHLK